MLAEKTEVTIHPELSALNNTIQSAILREVSEQLGHPVKWDDIEDYGLTLVVEVSLFETEFNGKQE